MLIQPGDLLNCPCVQAQLQTGPKNVYFEGEKLVLARIRDSSNPDSNLNVNFAGKREDSNPKVLIRIFTKICQVL
jgi:hypothetical protein